MLDVGFYLVTKTFTFPFPFWGQEWEPYWLRLRFFFLACYYLIYQKLAYYFIPLRVCVGKLKVMLPFNKYIILSSTLHNK